MSPTMFPHAETITLLAEHLAVHSARAAECYRLAEEASANGLHQHAATLVGEARGHIAKADSYRASLHVLGDRMARLHENKAAPGPGVAGQPAPAPFRNIRGPEDHA